MSEYREIQGAAVQSLASNTGTIEGQIWYDNVNGVFKLEAATTVGAWSSGGALPAIQYTHAGAGTQTAGITFGGGKNSPLVTTGDTNEYNGTSWTAGGSMSQARQNLGSAKLATQTTALGFGGVDPGPSTLYTNTEGYDGSSWTSLNAMVATKQTTGTSAGTQTAAMMAGGSNTIGPAGPGTNATTQDWNGTSWTSGNNMNVARQGLMITGTQTAGLAAIGYIPGSGPSTSAELYDGTSWTAAATAPSQGYNANGGGPQSSTFMSGGYPTTTTTSGFNGSSWYALPSMTTGRALHAAFGSAGTNGIAAGGYDSPTGNYFGTTEEWTGAGAPETKTITTT